MNDNPTPAALLRDAIARSGLSQRRFAVEVMGRDERTVRYWLAGRPIPRAALRFMTRYLSTRQGDGAATS